MGDQFILRKENFQPALKGLFDHLMEEVEQSCSPLAAELKKEEQKILYLVSQQHLGKDNIELRGEAIPGVEHYLTACLILMGLRLVFPQHENALKSSLQLLLDPLQESLLAPSLTVQNRIDEILEELKKSVVKEEQPQKTEKPLSLIEQVITAVLFSIDHCKPSPWVVDPEKQDILQINKKIFSAAMVRLLPSFQHAEKVNRAEETNRALLGGISDKPGEIRQEVVAASVVGVLSIGSLFMESVSQMAQSLVGAEKRHEAAAAGDTKADPAGLSTANIIAAAGLGESILLQHCESLSNPFSLTHPSLRPPG